MDNIMFQGAPTEAIHSSVPAARGLFTTHLMEPAFIVNCFQRYGNTMLDLAPLEKKEQLGQGIWVMKPHVRTCSVAEIGPVGLHFSATEIKSKGVQFKEIGSQPSSEEGYVQVARHSRGITARLPRSSCEAGSSLTLSSQPLVVVPAKAREHTARTGHPTIPRGCFKRPRALLDVPSYRLLDLRPHRCSHRSCLAKGSHSFQPTDGDVRTVCPEVLIHKVRKARKMYLTPRFRFQLLQFLYQTCSLRETRRLLLNVLSAGLLPLLLQGRVLDAELAISSVLCVPSAEDIKSISLRVFLGFVKKRVQITRRRQLIYNTKLIRSDGNNDIAARIRPAPRGPDRYKRCFTAVIAWCGTDGSLLEPPTVSFGEAFDDLRGSGEPMLEDSRDEQLKIGIPLHDTVPVGHSSDTYGKHYKLWPSVYNRVWRGLRIASRGVSPRGLAAIIDYASSSQAASLVTQCGEPRHEVIAHGRMVSTLTNDNPDIRVDHEDALNRLSAPLRPTSAQDRSEARQPMPLSQRAKELLRICVQETVEQLKQASKIIQTQQRSCELFLEVLG